MIDSQKRSGISRDRCRIAFDFFFFSAFTDLTTTSLNLQNNYISLSVIQTTEKHNELEKRKNKNRLPPNVNRIKECEPLCSCVY